MATTRWQNVAAFRSQIVRIGVGGVTFNFYKKEKTPNEFFFFLKNKRNKTSELIDVRYAKMK